jgi:hypothetical protein
MRHRFSLNARLDLYDAGRFYDDQRPGLATEFGIEVGIAITKITEAPLRWPQFDGDIRRFRLDRFPYGVFYWIVDQAMIEIVAVLDLRSDPAWLRAQFQRGGGR